MMIRRVLLAGSALAFTAAGSSVLIATGADAGTVNPYGTTGGSPASTPFAGVSHEKGDFCDPQACPLTTWKINFTTHKFKDGFGNDGTFTKSKKTYTFTIPNDQGSGVACTFVGTKNSTGFNSADSPGNYTCTDGTVNTWWLTLSS
jgi:hypothetical protein